MMFGKSEKETNNHIDESNSAGGIVEERSD